MKKIILFMVLATLCLFFKVYAQDSGGNNSSKPAILTLRGVVTSAAGNSPLHGASVTVKNTKITLTTDKQGHFTINPKRDTGTLVISFLGFHTYQLKFSPINQGPFAIHLRDSAGLVNEVMVIGYGTVTKRLLTGDVSKVTAEDISKQPVSNPLAALEGQVPGLQVTQSTGVNGAGFKVQLRGQSSLIQGSDPLFIIDGVPYSPGNSPLNQLGSAAGDGSSSIDGLSPFNLINPADIESIDILKDADATAIYGSRGANGVILITTKKGKAGKTIVSVNVYSGISRTTRTMDMLNTPQYLQMRREGFKNDGVLPTTSNAPDLLLWDTTRYTDFKKLLIGNTAHTTDAQLSLSGGSTNTQFLISGGYHHETTVFPTDLGDTRGSVHLNLNHSSNDKKLTINLSTIYSAEVNNLTASDLTGYINTPPNLKVYDAGGNLNWQEGGVTYASLGILNTNPLAFQYQTYNGRFQNLTSNLQLGYKLLPDLTLKVSMGYNVVNSNEVSLYPSTSLDPNQGQLPYSNFANQIQKSWIIEPQAEYVKKIGKGRLNLLIGNTWQDNSSSGAAIGAYDYSSDLLLNAIAAASYTETTNSNSQYRYDGIYGRINYNLNEKYLLNISGRRDGSSRFGPDNRFSNFGALGAAWIFSEETLIKRTLPFLSFGKLRGSYGLTGNDQIGNYKYLDTWTPGNTTYQGLSVLNPASLYNPAYSWEKNKKAEIALDLGFLKSRILFSIDYYNNRSSNQLINYTLPTQTGFSSVLENLNATIQNTGWEFQLNSKNIAATNFVWSSSLILTIPQNKLISFPGLASSSYANTYVIGQPLSTVKLYHSLGVDPATGVYQFQDVDKNGTLNNTDRGILKNTGPKFYGGFQNNISYKGLELSVFLEFKKQDGYNYLHNLNTVPGYRYNNQPVVVLSRWQQPGDMASIQKFTSGSTAVLTAASNLISSDAVISDASYIRCRNLSLSYNLPAQWLRKLQVSSCRVYVQGQNLFVITSYVGSDPENQNFAVLPPLKTLTAGIQFTL